MIIVDVDVPSIGRRYNFSLDEQVPIRDLLLEISEVLCQKENCVLGDKQNPLCLSDLDKGMILDSRASLSQYGISNGNRLILV